VARRAAPQIDTTRTYSTDKRAARVVPAADRPYMPNFQDDKAELIEQRFKRRLAELRWMRQHDPEAYAKAMGPA